MFCESREHFSPNVEKISTAHATRYDDISFCMGKQTRPCDFFLFDESFTHRIFLWSLFGRQSRGVGHIFGAEYRYCHFHL